MGRRAGSLTVAITGQRFLELNKVELEDFEVAGHALVRLRQFTGIGTIDEDQARNVFLRARQVKPAQLILLGYRMRYWGRKNKGEPSWYFRLVFKDQEMVAVVGLSRLSGFVWVTTYTRSEQTELYAVTDGDELGLGDCDLGRKNSSLRGGE